MTLLGLVRSQAGVPTVIIAIFFFGGIQLLFLGVIGEYILAIFNQVRRRPIVFEKERINFDRNPDQWPEESRPNHFLSGSFVASGATAGSWPPRSSGGRRVKKLRETAT
jgi:hypothetical protein